MFALTCVTWQFDRVEAGSAWRKSSSVTAPLLFAPTTFRHSSSLPRTGCTQFSSVPNYVDDWTLAAPDQGEEGKNGENETGDYRFHPPPLKALFHIHRGGKNVRVPWLLRGCSAKKMETQ